MERTLDFANVTSYGIDMSGSDVILRVQQPDIVTNIKIGIRKAIEPDIVDCPVRPKNHRTKMTADQVKEIRSAWDQMVKRYGTKTAAAEQLAQTYGCSSKNIYAIIYRYSWATV